MFHASNISCSPDLFSQYEEKSRSDEDRIIELFNEVKKPLTWFQVKGFLPGLNDCSIKRSLSDLTRSTSSRSAILIKTNLSILNPIGGKPCRFYELISKHNG